MNKAFEKILKQLEEKAIPVLNEDEHIIPESNVKEPYEIEMVALSDIKKTIQEVTEEYNGGWIPCSERLPDNDKKQYIVQKTNGFIDILGFTKDAYKLDRYDFEEYKGKKKQLFYDYDSEYGYTEWECEAWQHLPVPFKGA